MKIRNFNEKKYLQTFGIGISLTIQIQNDVNNHILKK